MASVTELFTSGDGDSFGVTEGSASRLFHVTVDSAGDKPTYVIRTPSLVGRSAVLDGSPYPNKGQEGYGLYAVRYTQVRKIDSLNFVVLVEYGPPVVFDALGRENPWHYSQSPGLGTKTLTYIKDDDGQVTDIGPRVYVKRSDNEGAYGAYLSGSASPVTFDQTQRRRIQEATTSSSACTFTLSRILASMTIDALGAAASYESYLNTNTFYGRPSFTVKFGGASINSEVGLAPGQKVHGIIFNVSLLFEYKSEGWYHYVQDTYTDSATGETVPIVRLSNNETQITGYKLDRDTPFDNILAIFNELA